MSHIVRNRLPHQRCHRRPGKLDTLSTQQLSRWKMDKTSTDRSHGEEYWRMHHLHACCNNEDISLKEEENINIIFGETESAAEARTTGLRNHLRG